MRDPHLRRQTLLARRVASGLPPWAAARGSNMPVEDMAALMFDAGFRALIDSFAGIMRMDRETRLRRMQRIAGDILDDALAQGDRQVAMFMRHEQNRKRDPLATLAKGFCNTLQREQAKAKSCVPRSMPGG